MHDRAPRADGRKFDELRAIRIGYDTYGYAAASVLFELGNTKVLCSVTLQSGVPPFLKGKKTGWLTAEYAMLPAATAHRTQRESSSNQRNGRSIEISRLIGRSLRAMVNLDALGEQTIYVDCDVLQADGGTRTACITGAGLALQLASKRWCATGILHNSVITEPIAAISVGLSNGQPLLDINYDEDSSTEADFNFVLAKSGSIIEIQGTAEKSPVSWEQFAHINHLAQQGTRKLFDLFEQQDNKSLQLPLSSSGFVIQKII